MMTGLLKPVSVFYTYGSRLLSTSRVHLAVDKSLLSKLRKQTGIPFINCKKALEKFHNDFDQAKTWLQEEAQKEGWARATKLQTRPMSQGLVALVGDKHRASLLEVNCETDFVARNDNFVSMVSTLVQDCDNSFGKQGLKKISLNRSELEKLSSSSEEGSSTLADIVVLNVASLGENMALRRAAFMEGSDKSTICSYIHPSNPSTQSERLQMGKYGALVELCKVGDSPSSTAQSAVDLAELGSHLCQHIVGMNPKSIGEFTTQEEVQAKQSEGVSEGDNHNETKGEEKQEDDELVNQSFLLDSSIKVGDLLQMNGVEVKDFVRFACGEELEGENQ